MKSSVRRSSMLLASWLSYLRSYAMRVANRFPGAVQGTPYHDARYTGVLSYTRQGDVRLLRPGARASPITTLT